MAQCICFWYCKIFNPIHSTQTGVQVMFRIEVILLILLYLIRSALQFTTTWFRVEKDGGRCWCTHGSNRVWGRGAPFDIDFLSATTWYDSLSRQHQIDIKTPVILRHALLEVSPKFTLRPNFKTSTAASWKSNCLFFNTCFQHIEFSNEKWYFDTLWKT